MTDSMKFGPEWLRNMKSDSSLVGGSGGGGTATIKMAEFRYGREEMLALFDRAILPPDPLKQMQGLYVDKTQLPLALIQMTEDETRMWNRGVISDVRKPGLGVGTRGALGGRGGSVDRGRGRARGSYHYSRGLSYEETDVPNGYNNRGMRNYDRTQSQSSWGERNGGEGGDYTATNPRKEFGPARSLSDTNWRRHRGAAEEDDGWRGTRQEKWGRGGSNSWREGDNWDRPRPWEEGTNNSHPPPRKPWEADENNLPEWAMENPSESGGSFDASGAFHGGTNFSDDEEGVGHKTEDSKSSGQPRPSPHSKKEPPNITNGASHHTGGESGPLRQSQSATSLASERRPTSHPLTSSASFSGVNVQTAHTTSDNHSKLQREEPPSKPSASPPRQHPHPHPHPANLQNLQPKKPAEAPPEPKATEKTSQEEEIEQRLLDAADVFVSQLMDEEERESPPAAPPATSPPPHPHPLADSTALWYYQDPQGNVQGPFQSSEMSEWFSSGYFKGTLLVRRACDERYSPLSELIKLWKGIPFMLDYYLIPPIKNNEPILPVLEDPLVLQYQLQQRLMLQRQAQALAKLTQSEHFNSLSLEQQQMLAHQAQMEMSLQAGLMTPHAHTNSNVLAMIQQLAQFQQLHQQQRPGAGVGVATEPLQQLMGLQTPLRPPTTPTDDQRSIEQFMNAFRQRQANPQPPPQPVTMESVWGGAALPAWSAPPGHPPPPQSLWAASDSVAKGIKTEQEVLEEQLRAEEEKKEELRKQEELLRRLKEEEKLEKQRRFEEEELERKRKEEEEEEKKERERELKRIKEEEERKKKEAAVAKKAEQDRLKKEEEKKRKEEEKRRKEEEKKRQEEEEKKKAEEEKKRLEEERKKKEEMAKRQNEALKRLQEQQQQARAVKTVTAPAPAPWTPPDTAAASLADIQKTERKQQQQLREQQEMLRQYQDKHQQEQQLKSSKSGSSLNLKWAEGGKNPQPARVKSLAEIQAEEHERMAKQAEKEKAERMAAVKEAPTPGTGTIWASASHSLSWNSNQHTASVWGNAPTPAPLTNSLSGSGPRFWDEVSSKASKPPPQQQQQQPVAAKNQAKTKSKKEEASVLKLFEKQMPKNSKSDEFYNWCKKNLSSLQSDLDIPTFVDFLWAFESHKEVREYIRMYLGETKEVNDFASEFIDRRSRLMNNEHSVNRAEPQSHPSPHNNHFQEVKGKNKKVKKSKMTKVDNRILGFNVTAAPDRINVGDRDYGEGL